MIHWMAFWCEIPKGGLKLATCLIFGRRRAVYVIVSYLLSLSKEPNRIGICKHLGKHTLGGWVMTKE